MDVSVSLFRNKENLQFLFQNYESLQIFFNIPSHRHDLPPTLKYNTGDFQKKKTFLDALASLDFKLSLSELVSH